MASSPPSQSRPLAVLFGLAESLAMLFLALGGALYLFADARWNFQIAAALMALGILAALRLPSGAGSVKSGSPTGTAAH